MTMVEVELRRMIPTGPGLPDRYERQAVFRVAVDGRVDVLEGPDMVAEVLQVRVADPASHSFIGAQDDPLVWARNLPGAFRSPYLVAVVREVDGAGPGR